MYENKEKDSKQLDSGLMEELSQLRILMENKDATYAVSQVELQTEIDRLRKI